MRQCVSDMQKGFMVGVFGYHCASLSVVLLRLRVFDTRRVWLLAVATLLCRHTLQKEHGAAAVRSRPHVSCGDDLYSAPFEAFWGISPISNCRLGWQESGELILGTCVPCFLWLAIAGKIWIQAQATAFKPLFDSCVDNLDFGCGIMLFLVHDYTGIKLSNCSNLFLDNLQLLFKYSIAFAMRIHGNVVLNMNYH